MDLGGLKTIVMAPSATDILTRVATPGLQKDLVAGTLDMRLSLIRVVLPPKSCQLTRRPLEW